MLTEVDVINQQGNTLALSLKNPGLGYTITEIDGLDPVKATIVTSSFALLGGSQLQSSKRESRNIVLKLSINQFFGSSTVAQLRTSLYAYFMPESVINMRFYDNDIPAYTIQGMVESCEAVLFSQTPEVAISIMCFDPDFKALSSVVINGNTSSSLTEMVITNPGTVEAGYVFQMNIDRSVTNFTIYNRRSDSYVSQMNVTIPLVAGDIIKISTEPKNKYATLTRAGVTTSILYAVLISSTWRPLWPGLNYFRVYTFDAGISFTITYTPRYGGM